MTSFHLKESFPLSFTGKGKKLIFWVMLCFDEKCTMGTFLSLVSTYIKKGIWILTNE
jgi:hypothetical protein